MPVTKITKRYKPVDWGEAVARYREGLYTFDVPPVGWQAWGEADWIHYLWGFDIPGDPTREEEKK